MCSVFQPRPHQGAESTELPKMAVVRQFGLLVWKNYIQQVSCGEEEGGGEHKLYFLIRCWHCLWLWIVTGCIYGVGTGRRVFVKLHPHSAIINTANWLTVWFQLVKFLPWSLIYCKRSACAVVVETAVRSTQCSCSSWSYMEICKMTRSFFFLYTSPKIYCILNLYVNHNKDYTFL